MRPIKLVMTGFGTYLKRTEIDFDKLGNSGLYIVTGDTGSGKTTIFDAVSYALYGEPSGEMRQTNMLRTIFATPETPTKVELTFEYGGKIYRIERNPAYPRPDKRNPEKIVMETASATLYKPGEAPLSNGKGVNVNDEIKAILGIDQKQFRQIVMIAQGQFQELIKQETSARIEIFRQLFGTGKYEKLQIALGEKSKSLKESVKTISASLKQYINQAKYDEDNVLNIELEKAKNSDIPWKEKLEVLEKIIKEDSELNEKLEKQRISLQEKMGNLKSQIGVAENSNKTKEIIKSKELELKEVSEKTILLTELYETEKAKIPEFKEKETSLTLAREKLSDYDSLDSIQRNIEKLEASIKIGNEKNSNYDEILTKTEEIQKSKESELKKLENVSEVILLVENDLDNLKALSTEFENAISSSKNLLKVFTDFKKSQKEFLEAKKDSETKSKEYGSKLDLYMLEQAGILAENLQEGEKCPVCGSIHHPSLAKKSEKAPNKEELDLLKEQKENSEQLAIKISEDTSKLEWSYKNELSNLQKKCETLLSESVNIDLDSEESIFPIIEKIQEKLNNLTSDIKKLEDKLAAEKKNKLLKEKLEKEIPELIEKTANIQKAKNDLTIEISKAETEKKVLENQKTETQKTLEFKTKKEAQANINQLENTIKGMQIALEAAQKNYDANIKNKADLESQIKSLSETIIETNDFDLEKAIKEIDSLKMESTAINNKIETLVGRHQINQDVYSRILRESGELIKNQEQEAYVTELYNTAVGKLGNKTAKIMLETYIQMTYFDRIIAFANKRFLIMTDKQYEMVRDETENAKTQGGLEINIIDHYNGGQRSIKSLSGGEQFQASLALALGLSDEIAQSAGGIKIDTLFVDEGFGTLDDETAKKAYNALISIAENNRLVGLISHIDLLKSKIDKQIIVKKKQNEGSFAEVIV